MTNNEVIPRTWAEYKQLHEDAIRKAIEAPMPDGTPPTDEMKAARARAMGINYEYLSPLSIMF